MPIRIAFLGFRHGHILELYKLAGQRPDVQVVAAVEDHEPTRRKLAEAGKVNFTHASCEELFADGQFDILAVGDYYGRRGQLLIRGLEAGKHVIADKPLCTSSGELGRIRELATIRGLAVGCMLTMRDSGNFQALRQIIRSGRLGEVHTISFMGQHPLLRKTRPEWYFESGKHGGTINDIAIHAIDAIPWMTGRKITTIVAARTWNGGLTEPGFFQVGAQLMLRLDNGGGVLGDVSYLAPDMCGYRTPNYWRLTVHGSNGQAETFSGDDGVTVYTHASEQAERVPPANGPKGGYFNSLLAEIAGRPEDMSITTAEVLESTRICLLAQECADRDLRDVQC